MSADDRQRAFDIEVMRRASYSAARLGEADLAARLREVYTRLTGEAVPE